MRAFFLFAVLLAGTVSAERIYGDIYEWENLSKVSGVVVRVYANGSLLRQEVVSSPYALTLPAGSYRIEMSWRRAGEELSAEENITLQPGTELRLDFLLLPAIEEIVGVAKEPTLLEEGFAPPSMPAQLQPDIIPCVAGALVVLALILALIYLFRARGRPSAKELEFNDKLRLLALIQERGAVRQSELVAMTGWSRAKVSMLLGELERERSITRQKTGREKIVRAV
ncbi:MAG: hypothetical protein QXG98_02130 [Candidatus Micrarchaeia archaeon]